METVEMCEKDFFPPTSFLCTFAGGCFSFLSAEKAQSNT